MLRPGSPEKHRSLVGTIRDLDPNAALRSSFIVGFPGETEADVDELADFLEDSQLDWAGFFPYSAEPGTPAATMDGQIPRELIMERLRHLTGIQDQITEDKNRELIGMVDDILIDQIEDGIPVARSHRQAPEIDGIIRLDRGRPGEWVTVSYEGVYGPDMEATVL